MTIVEAFVPNAYSVLFRRLFLQKILRWSGRERLFEPLLCGCSSVVEHLLAKEFSIDLLMFAQGDSPHA